ncbi:MAG TPA: hypothetical protein VMV10_09985 [Pirellulales bacterium]|nr:hypothetical protein [Pirellulales bacterium]
MTAYYLLPCSCGKKIEVDASQSGLNVRCECGAEVTVPAMRGLRELERTSAPTAARRPESPVSNWGARQGLMFLGTLILLCAALPAALTWRHYPQPPELVANFEELNREDIDQATLMQTFELWKQLRKDFAEEGEIPAMHIYLVMEEKARTRLIFLGVIGGIGLLMAIGGFSMKSAPTREPAYSR